MFVVACSISLFKHWSELLLSVYRNELAGCERSSQRVVKEIHVSMEGCNHLIHIQMKWKIDKTKEFIFNRYWMNGALVGLFRIQIANRRVSDLIVQSALRKHKYTHTFIVLQRVQMLMSSSRKLKCYKIVKFFLCSRLILFMILSFCSVGFCHRIAFVVWVLPLLFRSFVRSFFSLLHSHVRTGLGVR